MFSASKSIISVTISVNVAGVFCNAIDEKQLNIKFDSCRIISPNRLSHNQLSHVTFKAQITQVFSSG